MSSIEKSIRNAIKRLESNTPETRNRIYLAARDAIERLPEPQSETALQSLFDAVKQIETEYARQELQAGKTSTPPANLPPEQIAEPSPVADVAADQPLKRPRHQRSIPWVALIAAVVVLGIIGASSYLLWSQFQTPTPVSGQTPITDDAVSQVTEPAATAQQSSQAETDSGQESLTRLFTYESRIDLEKLATNPTGTKPLQPLPGDNGGDTAIALQDTARIYSRDQMKLEPGALYLMRVRLQIKPATDLNVILSAGLSAIGKNPDDPSKNKNFTSYFVHRGKVKPTNPKQGEHEFLFSGISGWDDLKSSIPLKEADGMVRPLVFVRNRSDETVVSLVAVTLEKL